MRVCKKCSLSKDLAEFPEYTIASNGRRSRRHECWQCRREYNYSKAIKTKYGLSAEDYYKLLEECGGACQTCGSEAPLVVDHCHTTEEVRGLLCHPCNVALGLIKDDTTTLTNMLNYLGTQVRKRK